MIPVDGIQDLDVKELARRARDFISSQRWCGSIVSAHLAWAAGRVLAICQYHIKPSEPNVDEVLWVVVGDVPPAYLVLDEAPTWQAALARYVEEMDRWVETVRAGTDLGDIIPVDVEPTEQHTNMLATRLAFIRSRLVDADPATLESDA
jgi:hypothetical protein